MVDAISSETAGATMFPRLGHHAAIWLAHRESATLTDQLAILAISYIHRDAGGHPVEHDASRVIR